MAEDNSGKDEKKKETASELLALAGYKKDRVVVSGIEKTEDFTELAKTQIAEAQLLVDNGELQKAIELLLSLEKKCRLGLDIANLKQTVTAMTLLCRKTGDWDKLNATLLVISKRHQQSKHAISAVVAQGSSWLDETPDKETKVKLLKTLLEVTVGKIYVEGERATLTRQLAAIKEADGDVDGACAAMLEVYVETYGALNKREKIDFILEQIRLCILKKDMVRAYIVSKKVSRKSLDDNEHQDLKLRFYKLMIEYHTAEKDAFELAQDFHSIYQTPCVLEDDGEGTGWRYQLKSCIAFLILSAHSPGQSDMLHRMAADVKLQEDSSLGEWRNTVKAFTTPEIIAFPLEDQQALEDQLRSAVPNAEIWEHMRKMSHERTTQHNIRVAAKNYKRIRTTRLAELLGLTTDEIETQLSRLVADGMLMARINRPANIISFKKPVSHEETLSAWASDIASLLTHVEHTCHLINKENMIHKI